MDLSFLDGEAEGLLRSLGELPFLDGLALFVQVATMAVAMLLKTLAFLPIALGTCSLLIRRWRDAAFWFALGFLPYALTAIAGLGPYFVLWAWALGALSYPGYWLSKRLARRIRERSFPAAPSKGAGSAAMIWSALRPSSDRA